MMAREGLPKGVDRAGADVAEDDADRAEREPRQPLLRMVARMPFGHQRLVARRGRQTRSALHGLVHRRCSSAMSVERGVRTGT